MMKQTFQAAPYKAFAKPDYDGFLKKSQKVNNHGYERIKRDNFVEIPRLEEVIPKLQQKNFRLTSKREAQSVPITTFRSPSSEPRYAYAIGPGLKADSKLDLKGSYQFQADVSKSVGPDTFRKSVTGQGPIYGNIAKILATTDDEHVKEPNLGKSASLIKIKVSSTEVSTYEMPQQQANGFNSKYFIQSNEIPSPYQSVRKPSVGEISSRGSPFMWKEKAKLRKLIDVQVPKYIANPVLDMPSRMLIKTSQANKRNPQLPVVRESEINLNNFLKRFDRVWVESAINQEVQRISDVLNTQENEREQNLITVKAPYQIRDKNYYFALRLENYIDFLTKANFSNMLFVIPLQRVKPQQIYRYHVKRGNNHFLIKNAFKQRWWWQSVELADGKSYDSINFLWSPWRMNEFINTLKKHDYEYAPINKENSLLETTASSNNESPTDRDKSDDPSLRWAKIKLQGDRLSRDFAALTDPKLYSNLKRIYSNVDFKNQEQYDELAGSLFEKEDRKLQIFVEEWRKATSTHSKYQFARITDTLSTKMCNHLENNFLLSNKKAMFLNLKHYYTSQKLDPFEFIPLTFHVRKGTEDPEFARFKEHYLNKAQDPSEKNIWIVKPGENTNRGAGITLCDKLKEVEELISEDIVQPNGRPKTFIVQKYIEKPMLYQRRKFDIRCYILITSFNGIQKGYWYQEGYVRTSSSEFNLDTLSNNQIHLTNDAVQKNCDEYGKHEPGNKIAYTELQRYFDQAMPDKKINFMSNVYPQLKKLALDAIVSVFGRLDPYRRDLSFELFGLDFMLEESGKPWLIEINTNPCLELSSPLLAKIIPAMIENLFRIAIDPIFPPPYEWPTSRRGWLPENCLDNNKFELIFDERDADIPKFGLNTANQHLGHIIDECEEDYDPDLME